MKSFPVLVLLMVILCGCGLNAENAEGSLKPASKCSKKEMIARRERLDADIRRLLAFSSELNDLSNEMLALKKTVKLKERGYYSSDEHDQIESILFRYLMCRESLWEIINYYRNYRELFETGEDRTRAFVTGFGSAIHLAYYSSFVIWTFMDNDAVTSTLNEKFYKSDIPAGTYDRLFKSVTSIDNIEALKTAWKLYSDELADKESELYRLSKSDNGYAEVLKKVAVFGPAANTRLEDILEKSSLFLPDVKNRLRNTAINELAKKAKKKIGDNLYAARGILFVNVSRLKSPLSTNIKLTARQLKKMKSIMKPGDLVMTFSAGYMSNIFLPGSFKHGIVYIGAPAERKALGLPDRGIPDVPPKKMDRAAKDVKTARISGGRPADLIEAVAEGVIFNSLESITDEHIARLCVLRPRISRQELAKNLTNVFLLLGNVYDFKFDFTDGSCLCCTEVIYRALHKVGPIDFKLIRRMGVQTLAADDIINYSLSDKAQPFDFVLLAEEDPAGKSGTARVLTGAEGRSRLAELMKE